MIKETKYAPIIIPTLNRYEHLKRCLESLSQNYGAEQTDVFISVDYPPSEKYQNGYEKISDYLRSNPIGFHKIKVFFQDHNLGPYNNYLFLLDYISSDYTTFIYTEDDNVFSSDFLSYMNYCLKKYEEDLHVQAVDGYMWPTNDIKTNDIIRINSLFNAWGYGGWVKKEYKLLKRIEQYQLSDIWNNRKMMRNLKEQNPFIYTEFIKSYIGYSGCLLATDNSIRAIDLAYSLVEFIEGTYTVFPIRSKVKNYGTDGSGVNCSEIIYNEDEITNNRNYDYSSQEIINNYNSDYREIISSTDINNTHQKLKEFLAIPPKEIFKANIAYYISYVIGIRMMRQLIKRIKK